MRVSGDPTHLLFEVYDQGEGLLPGEGEKVFDPFFLARLARKVKHAPQRMDLCAEGSRIQAAT